MGEYSDVRDLLLNSSVDNLDNSGLPFGPGDFTGAFQWDLIVPAGGTVTVETAWAINPAAVPEPATLAFLGAGVLTAGLGYRRWKAIRAARADL